MVRLKEKKKIHCVGYYEFRGKIEKLWAKGYVSKPQHEGEITEYIVNLHVDDILRRGDVDKFDTDAILLVNGTKYYLEHDRDTMNLRQMKAKMRKLSACPNDVLWVCPSATRVSELKRLAPNDRHWFTTFDEILRDPHGLIFKNNKEETASLDRTTS